MKLRMLIKRFVNFYFYFLFKFNLRLIFICFRRKKKFENKKLRGSLNRFPDFFRMGTFIDSKHMKLVSPSN